MVSPLCLKLHLNTYFCIFFPCVVILAFLHSGLFKYLNEETNKSAIFLSYEEGQVQLQSSFLFQPFEDILWDTIY